MAEGGGGGEPGPAQPHGAARTPSPALEPSSRPDTETQKNELGELLKAPLKKGDEWYLVDSRWYKQWKKYVGFDSWDVYNVGESNLFPGPVDNSGLFADSDTQVLKEHLIDELDYVLVPTEAWNKLMCWYGSVPGQQPIVRKVVEHGMFVKHCKVEVYLIELKLCENSDLDNVVMRHFSKADTIESIEKEMRNIFNIPVNKETRLWNKYMTNTFEQLTKPDNTVQDAGLYQGQILVIEQRNPDGTWPRQPQSKSSTATSRTYTTSGKSSSSAYSSLPSSSSSSSSSSSTITNGDSAGTYGLNSSSLGKGGYGSSYNSYSYRDPSSKPGLCGLSNLGNTCFMNSALQCLSNTPPLTEYFLTDEYKDEINRDNPLGMKGEIATAYAELIRQIWSGEHSYVAPRMFKTQVGRFAPQFSGYQQQDSQELLAFLLDGLHEDLNRVKKKPYLELKDANGRPDSVVATEAWDNHLRRNNSIIVDIFHGLFKSTLVCPECSKVSVTFDPFCYLTLPLPMKKDRTMEVFLVRADPQCKPTQYRLIVPKMGTVSDLCSALSKLSGVPAENMVVTDVYNHRFHKIFQTDEMLNHIMERDDLFVYEVKSSRGSDSEWLTLPICFRERRFRQSSAAGTILFGQPLLISVPRQKLTTDMLYNLVLERIQRYIKTPLPEEYSCLSSDAASCNGSNGIYDDEEMDHQEEREESPEESNGQSDDSVEDENSEGCSPCNKMPKKAQDFRKRLFCFSLVNSYATSDVGSMPAEGSFLKLTSYSTVAIDWDTETKKLYYDDQEAEAFGKHESMMQPQKKKMTVALRDCIQLFTKTEVLGEHDPWYCPNCRKHQRATKKFDLWSLPKILVVHLKRFSYNRYWRDKLDAVVEFPIRNLNMSEFVCDPTAGPYVYDLVAVSNHYGGMGGGHYTAYAKNQETQQWYYFDDSSVSPASEDQIVTKAAYVLFYQRQDGGSFKASSPAASLGSPPIEDDLGEQDRQQDLDCMDTN